MRRVMLVVATGLLMGGVAVSAVMADARNSAKVGDPISILTKGLIAYQGVMQRPCLNDNHFVGLVTQTGWYAPGRDPEHNDLPSAVTSVSDKHIEIAATFDESNLNEVVAIYADRDGKGLVTDVWTPDSAPKDLCKVLYP